MDIYLSVFLLDNNIDLRYMNYRIIFDIDKNIFIKNVDIFYNNLLYVLFINNKNITIINDPIIINDYFYINNLLIHENMTTIDTFLYLESWYNLLDSKVNIKNNYKYELEELNKNQLEAVKHINGVVNVIAPAGSGKTKTLVNRIIYLINNNINKDNILVLAYNKKACNELTSRLSNKGIDITISTFHSFGNNIITKYTNLIFDSSNIYNEEIIKKIKPDISKYDIDRYINYITNIKENILSEEEINNIEKDLYDFYLKYLKEFEDYGYYNYEDMVYITLILILRKGELRKYLQDRYKYILVDEFQDLNKSQLLLLKILSLPTNNLFLVGDDDQMIYSFRGTNNNITRDFINNYKYLYNITLNINYRSHNNIVRHAKWLINNNIDRYNKDINSYSNEDGNISIYIDNDINLINYLTTWINNLYKEGYSNNDTVIICRYNKDVEYLKCFLRIYNYETGYSYKEIKKARNIIYTNKLDIKKSIVKRKIKLDKVLVSILDNYSVKKQYELLKYTSNRTIPINITTIHKTKGNEYKNVCIYFKLDKCFTEEERRVFYVGVTRPMDNLIILSNKINTFIKEYALNNDYKDKSINNLINISNNLEEINNINNLKLNLYKKDSNRINNMLMYEINEKKEDYLKKEELLINNLSKDINNNNKELSLLKEEIIYRKSLNIK